MELYRIKQKLREEIARRKREYTNDFLSDLSQEILKGVENRDEFRHASSVALYHAIPGEVQTAAFIEKWKDTKEIYLPTIRGEELLFTLYTNNDELTRNAFGILEPTIGAEQREAPIDLIIVPGIAFDRSLNRMGRGKGYYDRFLQNSRATKVGLCFNFQLFDNIPTHAFDSKMDMILTEDQLLC